MSWLSVFFNEVFYRPLLNALVYLTGFLPYNDLGFAVIILTIAVRLIIFPLTHRAIKTQNKMKMIEPELKKIKDGVKDREEQARKTMELYRAHGINPFSGMVLLFLQLPVLIAMYLVFRESSQIDPSYLYGFISMPDLIHDNFLGFINLGQRSILLAFLAALSQFVQIKLSQPLSPPGTSSDRKAPDFSKMLSWQMTYFMPVLIFFIATRFPSAVSLYWTTLNIFAIVHEGMVRKKAKKILNINEQRSDPKNSDTDRKPS